MRLDPLSLAPTGSRLVVKRDSPPTTSGPLTLPSVAAGKKVCPACLGKGCFPVPVYEEDGIWVAKHVEIPCEKCHGRGYKSKGYDPRQKLRSGMATVVAVGPGKTCRKTRKADGKIVRWYEGQEPMPLKPGDRVLLAKWAGVSMESFPLDEKDDGYLIVNLWEIVAVQKSPVAFTESPS